MRNLRTILVALALLGFITAKADAQGTVKGIVIETAGGQRTEYALTETPKLTYDGNTVTLTTTKVSVDYTASNILKVMLTDISSTGINDVESSLGNILLSNDEVRMSGLAADESVTLYNVNGMLLSSWKATSMGELTISLSDLSRGVYIIKANHQSFKVTRK
jgi:hypothetical protein